MNNLEVISAMEENHGVNGKRGFGARALSGIFILLFAILLISFLNAYIVKPILSIWEPVFIRLFGDIKGELGSSVPKFLGFFLFSCSATIVTGLIIDAIVNSRHFSIISRLLHKLPFVKSVLSFFQSAANAYRNLKQARPVLLRIGGIEIPAFVTKERTFQVDGRKSSYFVLYCPHTPTFLTGNTLYIRKEEMAEGRIVDIPQSKLIEDVISAGIFGVRDELRTQKTE
ncbi:MAG: DUF502 domain-containing protein [Candidatus Sungiibacteriota bacterium]